MYCSFIDEVDAPSVEELNAAILNVAGSQYLFVEVLDRLYAEYKECFLS
jgi:hypothetical protein